MDVSGEIDLAAPTFSDLDPEGEERGIRVYNIADFLALRLPAREYLVEPWLAKQSLAMVHAWRGVGKTWFALSLALAVATGGRFLKWSCPLPHRVLYVDGEMPGSVLQERLASLMAGAEVQPAPDNLKILAADVNEFGLGSLDDKATQEVIMALAADVDLIVFDNLSTLIRGGVENEGESWLPVQTFLLELRRQGKSVLLVHHQGKNREQRGTSRREDILDAVISLEAVGPSGSEAQFRVVFQKSRGAFGPDIAPFQAALEAAEDGGVAWTISKGPGADLVQVAALHRERRSLQEIGQLTGTSKSTAKRNLDKAKEQGLCDDE